MTALTPRQLPLSLSTSPRWTREDFMMAPHVEAALRQLDAWPNWKSHGLVLVGPSGCGKTHLAHIWASSSNATFMTPETLNPESLPPQKTLVFDPMPDLLAGRPKAEEALFHLLNRAAAERGSLLFCASSPPAQWSISLPDLSSRLKALPVVFVTPADEAALLSLMAKLFSDRQLRVPLDVMAYIVTRIERSPAQIIEAVARLDAAALSLKRPITQPFAREVLGLHG